MDEIAIKNNTLGHPVIRIIATIIGAGAFCIYSHGWHHWGQLTYDIVASLTVYSFVAQLLAEAIAHKPDRWWWIRFIAVIIMSIFTTGREFLNWPVSGHVSTVTAVSLIQQTETRMSKLMRFIYLSSLPIIIALRIFVIDQGVSTPFLLALLVGFLIASGTLIGGKKLPNLMIQPRS